MQFTLGPIEGVEFQPLQAHADGRGWLVELYRADELATAVWPVMAYLSETGPGLARGPHEHRAQTDCFAFIGPGDFRLYLWDARPASPSFGNRIIRTVGAREPHRVLVPPGVVHAYRNVGATPGWVFNAANRLYAGPGRREPVDEIRHELAENSPFVLD